MYRSSHVTTSKKILLLDIETAPNIAYVWGLFDQNISHDQVKETSRILCWSAKWLGSSDVMFSSEWNDGQESMLMQMYELLAEADIVVHYYGSRFDIPVLNREFLKRRLPEPGAYAQIDLKILVARRFKFLSNKLAHVLQQLELGEKIKTDFELWVGCMDGDPKAQAEMERYNRNDVTKLEDAYMVLRPWLSGNTHAPRLAVTPEWPAHNCPVCESTKIAREGTVQPGIVYTYPKYRCDDCGAQFRARKSIR